VAKSCQGLSCSVTDSPGITEYLDAPRRTWITDMSRVFEFCDLLGLGDRREGKEAGGFRASSQIMRRESEGELDWCSV